MMIFAPLVSYLIAESLSISGLLSLMTCAFILSIYAKRNLSTERSFLINSCFGAFSYFSSSICDLLMGLGLGIYLNYLKHIGIVYILVSVILTFALDFFGTWVHSKLLLKYKMINKTE